MSIINTKTLEDYVNYQLSKWQEFLPDINVNSDSMVYMDATVIAEVLYLLQQDAVTLTNNAFLAYAIWDELTNLWLDRGIDRRVATNSAGILTFWRATIAATDYIIPVWTIVSTQPAWDGTVITFITDIETILYWQLSTPGAITGNALTSGWAIWNWTYTYTITALWWDLKETDESAELVITVSNWLTTNANSLSWTAVTWAYSYNVYLNNIKLANTVSASYTDISGSTGWETQTPPVTNETGNLTVSVAGACSTAWLIGNVSPNTITAFIQKPTWIETVTNSDSFIGWANAEDDDVYRARIKSNLTTNNWKVTVTGYAQTVENLSWVATATVVHPIWELPNVIDIYITSTTNGWVPDWTLIDYVQAQINLDENRAVCDDITIKWPDVLTINVTINILEYDTNYSTIDIENNIINWLTDYFPGQWIGAKIRVVEISNIIHDVNWVLDFIVTDPVANIQLTATQVWVAGTITVNFI